MEYIEKIFIDLLDDPEFSEISSSEAKFNVFEALGVKRQEIRNSDFLAYMLDPNRSHGLRDKPLRKFLLKCSSLNLSTEVFNPIELRLTTLDNVSVYREKYRVDIIIENPGKWVVFVENKIDAGEGGNQLNRYEDLISSEYDNLPCLLIYLTPEGVEASNDNWLPVSHRTICECFSELVNEEPVSSSVLIALEDYIDYMESHVLDDTRIADICRSVYKKHREVIDLIVEHMPSARDVAIEAAKEAMLRIGNKGLVVLDAPYRRVPRAIDKNAYSLIPTISDGAWTPSNKAILYEWDVTSKSLRFDLVIGHLAPEERSKLIDNLQEVNCNEYRHIGSGVVYTHISKSVILNFEEIDGMLEDDQFCALVEQIEERVIKLISMHSETLQVVLKKD